MMYDLTCCTANRGVERRILFQMRHVANFNRAYGRSSINAIHQCVSNGQRGLERRNRVQVPASHQYNPHSYGWVPIKKCFSETPTRTTRISVKKMCAPSMTARNVADMVVEFTVRRW